MTENPSDPGGRSLPTAAPEADVRSHFLAHMGHELRSPLTNIMTLAEAVREGIYGPLNEQQTSSLAFITENAQRMIDLVNDLVDLAKIETGAFQLTPEPCEAASFCVEGFGLVEGLAKSRKTVLSTDIGVDGITVSADARKMRQLVAGLAGAAVLSNAVGSQVQLRVQAQPGANGIVIQVTSAPPGANIAPPDAFDEATSAAVLDKMRRFRGVGLAWTEKIVAMHGGSLTAGVEARGGTSLTARLPLPFLNTTTTLEVPAADGISNAVAVEGAPLILLADDEADLRSVAADYLESIGYRVVCATNGREAVDMAARERPDLIILNMQMPVMDGLQAMQNIRSAAANGTNSTAPIIGLSGMLTPGFREQCLRTGAFSCLAKPFGIGDLERAIKEALASPASA